MYSSLEERPPRATLTRTTPATSPVQLVRVGELRMGGRLTGHQAHCLLQFDGGLSWPGRAPAGSARQQSRRAEAMDPSREAAAELLPARQRCAPRCSRTMPRLW